MKTLRNNLLSNVYSPINNSLENVKDEISDLSKSYNDEKHLPFLSQLLEYSLNSSGKKLRPTLSLLSAGFGNQNLKTVEKLAAAVELLHIATLVHDDTVDDSNFRRGKATISNLWGDNSAVLIGDYIFAAAASFICETNSIYVIKRFSETIMELSAGELDQMYSTYSSDQTKEKYFKRIYKKTASLFTTASESGAILSNTDQRTINALKNFGYNLGMAFQIIDDILDFTGDSQKTGKPTSADLSKGTLTLPSIISIEKNPIENPIIQFLDDPSNNILLSKAIENASEKSNISEALKIAEQFCKTALNEIKFLPENSHKIALIDLVDYVLTRDK